MKKEMIYSIIISLFVCIAFLPSINSLYIDPAPDLDCYGNLNWVDIIPGSVVTGEIIIENVGEPGSLLYWEIGSWPDWGIWTFNPESGVDLLAGDTLTINIELVTPTETGEYFTGEIIIINSNDPSDYCIVDVTLSLLDSIPIPDLDCQGDLSWVDVKPGDIITGSLEVENVGEIDSLLNWEVDSWPDWGTWFFNPDDGIDLSAGDTIQIDIEIVAPPEPMSEYSGEVKIVNSENASDFCIVTTSIVTSYNYIQNPILVFLENHFQLFYQILTKLFIRM